MLKSFLEWFIRPKGAQGGLSERVGEPSFVPSDMAGTASAAVVMVASLDGAEGEAAARRITDILVRRPGMEVRRIDRALKLSGPGSLIQKLVAAGEHGREWLAADGGDLLIWGEAAPTGITLRFIPLVTDDGRIGGFGLGDTLELPVGFGDELADALLAIVLAAAAPSREGRRHRLGEMLALACDRSDPLVVAPPETFGSTQKATLLTSLGNAFGMSYRLTRDAARLQRCIEAQQKAVGLCSLEDSPLVWALCQNHLAAALEAMADADKQSDALEEAAEAYKAVAQALARDKYPHDWALAKTRLGQVYYRIASRKGRAQELKSAIEALESALQVYTREAMPGRWSEVLNHMGVAMLALGEQVSGTVVLEQAAATFRLALEVRKREVAPLLWAQTANNLGAAAFALAKRNGEIPLLDEAQRCFEGAVEVYKEQGRSKTVHVIEKNLNRVARLLETRRRG